ncbi:MAG: hypothetical protein MUP71_11770 [Candidatus Aminicenantes bacterium]|nr:hypothetical protein [Candidatus Aminicenantes bacterium]
MKRITSFWCNCLTILVFIFIFSSSPIFATVGQVRVFDAGVNLGIAKGRAQFFDRATVESRILNDLIQARDNIIAGETEFARFFTICETRRTQIARIVRLLNDYSTATRNLNQHRKMIYIKNIFDMYRKSLALTLDSSRPDTCRAQSNCDEHLALAAFSFGQAWIVTLAQGSRFRNFQSGWVGLLRDQVRQGIWLSMDIPNQRILMTGIRKLCCSFGAKAEWDQHVAGLTSNSPPQAFNNVLPRILDTIRRANLNGTPCQSEEHLEIGNLMTDQWYYLNGVMSARLVRFRSDGTVNFRERTNQIGHWSLDSRTNVLSFWGTSHGRFSGQVYARHGSGFQVVGAWDNGKKETLYFIPMERINPG